MQFIELSTILKQKRIENNISQQELAQKLKIPLRGINALEEGDLSELPHETYIRTFIKEYAKRVGLDYDEVRVMLNNIEEFEDQVEPPKSMEAKHAESEPKGVKSKGVRIAVPLLLLALIGTTTYFYYSNGKLNFQNLFSLSWLRSTEQSAQSGSESTKLQATEKNNQTEKNSTSSNQELKTQTPSKNQSTEQNNTQTQEEGVQNTIQEPNTIPNITQNEANATQTAHNTKNKEEIAKEEKANASAQAELDFETFIAKTPEASLIDWTDFDKQGNLTKQAIIYVKQDCWMQVIIDGKDGHFTLRAKNQRKFDFNKSIQFKIGNASAVTLFHGYDLVNVGDSSVLRVVTLNAK